MVAIGVVAAILVSLVAVLIPWLPDSASEEMDRITFVYWFATVICIAIFALVTAVILYSVVAFRAQPEDDTDGPPIHGHTGLEIAWTIVPFILVVAIGVISAVVLSKNGQAGSNPMQLKVFAQQFAWRFEYPQANGLRTRELVLPVDRSIEIHLQAADVIHSFWIPEMGQKQDAVPGIDTRLVITPTRTGTFSLICTELCGLGHATMRAPVRVVSTSQFAAWVREQQQAQGGGAGEGNGGQVFASNGCGGCHTFAPASSDGQVGPDLDDLAAAAQKAGKPVDEFTRESIVEPDAYVAPGYSKGVMPATFGDSLSDTELDALVQYLTEKKE
jgi:cytochrome c oxidase subunit 2